MEQIVKGCVDCPMWDCTGEEYEVYCHHPKVPVMIGTWNDGVFTENTEIIGNERGLLIKQIEEEGAKNPLWIENYRIQRDGKGEPITPDFCPLKKEPITISIKE